MSKAIESGKMRGFKDIQAILDSVNPKNAAEISEALRKVFESGALTPESLSKVMILQKAMNAIGAKPEIVAKTIALQKTLIESGMSKHEIANAMALAMALGLDVAKSKQMVEDALNGLKTTGLSRDEIDSILALTQAIESGAEIPPEVIRLIKKAMKQRRGSVENIAETLMASLAGGGDSQESIVKAMVRALKATGASPEEIAKTMSQAMRKGGASNEDIARVMAAALADAGASSTYHRFI